MVRYILKQDVPSSLEDALKVAEAYMLPKDEIYSLRIIDLIDREQVWKVYIILTFIHMWFLCFQFFKDLTIKLYKKTSIKAKLY